MNKLNVPNQLTLMRVLLVPAFVTFMMIEQLGGNTWLPRVLSAALFLLCALTDLFDGMIARKTGQVTDFGKFLDPIADKFMVFSALMAFCASPVYAPLRVWMLTGGLLVILRELAVTSLRLLMAGRKTVIAAAWPGKVKTVTQVVFVMVAMLEAVLCPWTGTVLTLISLAVMVAATVFSGISYVKQYWPALMGDE